MFNEHANLLAGRDDSPWPCTRAILSSRTVRVALLIFGFITITYPIFHNLSPFATDLEVSNFKNRAKNAKGLLANVQEDEPAPGVQRYTRIRQQSDPDLLWLVMTYDNSSWGTTSENGVRNIDSLHELIASQYDAGRVSLGLLTSSIHEYQAYKESLESYDYAKTTIYYHTGYHDGLVVDRKNRHNDDVQVARRSEMAKLRNYLMLKTLADETHILWSDADVFEFDKGIVTRMIQHSDESDEYGIFTARCEYGRGGDPNYDKNAWRGTREKKDGGLYGFDGDKTKWVTELIRGTNDDDLIPLSAVGGTILYMRSSLVHQGVNFPHQHAVGTSWYTEDGTDGPETEGLCYRARGLQRGKCAVLGGSWHVIHVTS